MSEQRFIRPRVCVAAAVAVSLVAACSAGDQSSSGGDNKAGGSADPVVLTMANPYSGLEGEPAVQYFVDQVGELSDAAVRIDARHEVGAFAADAEQQVVRGVASGEFDLAWVGTRVFDTLGVNSFRALSAPLLIDSYPLQQAVIESDIPADMLAGLDKVGVTGIAVLADGLRKPIAVDHPLLSPADFDGITFQSFRSTTQADAIRALGANPIDSWSRHLDAGLKSGDVDGFEKNLHIYNINETSYLAPYVTANVNLWPQTVALIANPDTLADLSDTEREWLMQAGADAAEQSTGLVDGDAETLSQLCTAGARFANATDADLDALREAFAPVYATLEQDPQTRQFIDQIRQLNKSTDPGPALDVPSQCTGSAPATPAADNAAADGTEPTVQTAVPAALDGTYRWTVTEQDARANGVTSPEFLAWQPSVATMTLDDGQWEVSWRGANGQQATDGPGTYTVEGNRIVLKSPTDHMEFTFSVDADGNVDVEPVPPMAADTRLVFGYYQWTRIDSDPADGSAETAALNGTYRLTITKEDVLAHAPPADRTPENLATLPWIFTTTFNDGTCHLEMNDGYSDTCTYIVEDDRIVVDWASGAGPFEYTFTRDDDGTLHLQPAGPMPDGDAFVTTTKPWEKID